MKLYFESVGDGEWEAHPRGWASGFFITRQGSPLRYVGRYGRQTISEQPIFGDALMEVHRWAYNNRHLKCQCERQET